MKIKHKHKLFMIFLFLLIVILAMFSTNIYRTYQVVTLYNEDKIVANFLNMHKIFPARQIPASTAPYQFTKAKTADQALPNDFYFADKNIPVTEFLNDSSTTGLVVIKNDQIVTEKYFLGHDEQKLHTSFSMAKSFISALFGIAISEGYIKNIDQSVTDYVPELRGSGYEGVRLKDILQMSSGVHFNEDYGDFFSDINRFSRSMALGTSLDNFTASLTREREPGTYHHYVSIDTQVLGMVLTRAINRSLSDYLQEKIWQPLGMEQQAFWITDDTGMEAALCCMSVSLKDYAKFARLYLHRGRWNGLQIIPESWVMDSITPDAPHLMPGANNPNSSSTFGYGYQWWIPVEAEDEFMAMGIYGQYIYIDPDQELIIVKNSANHRYTQHHQLWKSKHLALFRAISAQLQTNLVKIKP
jgi:hypothetical protein